MNSFIRVGIVGVGTIARTYFAAFRNMKNVRVVFLCDIVHAAMKSAAVMFPDILADAGQFASSDEAFDKIGEKNVDFVLVATPIGTHFMLAERVLKRGVRTLLEKPAVWELQELKHLYALAREKRTHFQTMYHNAFAPEVIRFLGLRTDIERFFGSFRGFSCELLDPAVPRRVFEVSKHAPGGSYMNSAVNALSVLESVFGAEIFASLRVSDQIHSQLPGLRDTAQNPLAPSVDTNSITQYETVSASASASEDSVFGGVIRTEWGRGWNFKATLLALEHGTILLSHTAQTVTLDDFETVRVLECAVPETPKMQRQYEIMFSQLFFTPDSLECAERRDTAIHRLLLEKHP